MVGKDRIRSIREVLDTHNKLTFNKFKEIVVKEKKLMAIGTFTNALKEAEKSGIIRREKDQIGQKVWYSLPEIAKNEDEYYDYLSATVTGFQIEFERLESLFSELNDVEKGKILFCFLDLYYEIQSKIALGHFLFHSSKFADISHFMVPYLQDLDKLSISGDEKQQTVIWNETFMGWGDVEDYNMTVIDDLLKIAEANLTK